MTRGPILSYALDRVQQITIIDSSIKEKFPISFAVEASSRLFATKSTSSKLGAMDGMLKFWGNLASVARAVVGATEGLSKAAKVNRSTGELQAFRDGVVPKVPSSQQFLDMLAVERAMVQACRDNQVPNTNFDYVASAAEADFGVHYAFDLLVDHGSLPLDPTLLTASDSSTKDWHRPLPLGNSLSAESLKNLASSLSDEDALEASGSNVHCLLDSRDKSGAQIAQGPSGDLPSTSVDHALPLMYDGDVAFGPAPAFALLCTPLGTDQKQLVWAETSQVWEAAGDWVRDKIVSTLKQRKRKVRSAGGQPSPDSIDHELRTFDFKSITPAMCRLVAAATTAAIGDYRGHRSVPVAERKTLGKPVGCSALATFFLLGKCDLLQVWRIIKGEGRDKLWARGFKGLATALFKQVVSHGFPVVSSSVSSTLFANLGAATANESFGMYALQSEVSNGLRQMVLSAFASDLDPSATSIQALDTPANWWKLYTKVLRIIPPHGLRTNDPDQRILPSGGSAVLGDRLLKPLMKSGWSDDDFAREGSNRKQAALAAAIKTPKFQSILTPRAPQLREADGSSEEEEEEDEDEEEEDEEEEDEDEDDEEEEEEEDEFFLWALEHTGLPAAPAGTGNVRPFSEDGANFEKEQRDFVKARVDAIKRGLKSLKRSKMFSEADFSAVNPVDVLKHARGVDSAALGALLEPEELSKLVPQEVQDTKAAYLDLSEISTLFPSIDQLGLRTKLRKALVYIAEMAGIRHHADSAAQKRAEMLIAAGAPESSIVNDTTAHIFLRGPKYLQNLSKALLTFKTLCRATFLNAVGTWTENAGTADEVLLRLTEEDVPDELRIPLAPLLPPDEGEKVSTKEIVYVSEVLFELNIWAKIFSLHDLGGRVHTLHNSVGVHRKRQEEIATDGEAYVRENLGDLLELSSEEREMTSRKKVLAWRALLRGRQPHIPAGGGYKEDVKAWVDLEDALRASLGDKFAEVYGLGIDLESSERDETVMFFDA